MSFPFHIYNINSKVMNEVFISVKTKRKETLNSNITVIQQLTQTENTFCVQKGVTKYVQVGRSVSLWNINMTKVFCFFGKTTHYRNCTYIHCFIYVQAYISYGYNHTCDIYFLIKERLGRLVKRNSVILLTSR